MKTIMIGNGKGGIGKTTTALSFGTILKQMGYRVLFMDFDQQGSLTRLCGAERGVDDRHSTPIYSVSDVALADSENRHRASEAIQKCEYGDIIASDDYIQNGNIVLTKDFDILFALKEELDILASENLYDYVVIDTAPRLDHMTQISLIASDYIIIPVQSESESMQTAVQLAGMAQKVQKRQNPNLVIAGFLETAVNTRTNIYRDMHSEMLNLAEMSGTRVFKSPIRFGTSVKESLTSHVPLPILAKKSPLTKDYKNVVREFLTLDKGDE